MPLSAAQKSQIRRHLGLENVGFSSVIGSGGAGTLGVSGGMVSGRINNLVEIKLNSLQPCDEAALTGKAYASVQLLGLPPALNDTVTLIFSNVDGETSPLSSTVTLDVIAGASQVGDMGKLAMSIAVAISQNSNLASAGFQALAPYGPGSNVLNPQSEVSIINSQIFKLSVSITGSISATALDDGSVLPEPSAQVGKISGVPNILHGYLPLLNYLHGAIASATTRQGTAKADVFTARASEVPDRIKLYEFYRRDMARFLGLSLGGLGGGASGSVVI